MKKITFFIFACIFSHAFTQTITPYILIDQFGYMPKMKKVAVIRDPQIGYDASESFTPGSNYAVVNSASKVQVLTGVPVSWNSGVVDSSSGDRAWWFDFTSVRDTGTYYILDISNNVRSFDFRISDDVYKNVMKAAMRMFFYQRSGCAKDAQYAGAGWADGVNHLGALQDLNCRVYNDKNNATTEHDLHGGWFDAGDQNKYTAWATNYVIGLLRAYKEFPTIFTDDYNIPESGNGIPDILDETKWEMDWLLRMQLPNGSCLSVMGDAYASPPSSATGQSLYGLASTNATMSSAAAFAYGAKIYGETGIATLKTYADTLQARAVKAWNWASANPYVLFHSNSSSNGTNGVLPGDQEVDSLGRFTSKMMAAVYLFDLTSDTKYRDIFDQNYKGFPLFAWWYYVDQYRAIQQDIMMYYTSLPDATPSVCANIKNYLITAFNKTGDFIPMIVNDPYRAFIKSYNWGSNQYKADYSYTFYDLYKFNLDQINNQKYLDAAVDYLHYIHGVNPFNMVYMTNMSSYGAKNSASTIYHTWFCDGSPKWDQVGVSTYGPAPGYIPGGPNVFYNWNSCCPSSCGSSANNQLCTAISISPPVGQPPQKSYKDFNINWPLDSWEITEPDCGYQTDYIRMISMVIGTQDSSVITNITDHSDNNFSTYFRIYPNPAQNQFKVEGINFNSTISNYEIQITNIMGQKVLTKQIFNINETIDVSDLRDGMYFVIIGNMIKKLLINR